VRLEHQKVQRATETFYALLDEHNTKSIVDKSLTQFDEMYWNKWCVNAPVGSARIPIKRTDDETALSQK